MPRIMDIAKKLMLSPSTISCVFLLGSVILLQSARTEANPPGSSVCQAPVDIVFLVDSSGSVGLSEYEKQKSFVKMVAERLDISPSKTRASVIVYSDSASIEARWDQYTNYEDFAKAVDKLPYRASSTRIDKALRLAASDLFPHARPKAKKIAAVITDGRLMHIGDAAESLKKIGVRIIAVGVGSGVLVNELRELAESEENVVLAEDFTKLNQDTDKLVRIVCARVPAGSIHNVNPMDVAFLLDSSGSIGRTNYEKQKDFVSHMAQKLIISPNYCRAALVIYHGTASVRANFDDYRNTGDFQRAVRQLPYTMGRSRVDQALDLAAHEVFSYARDGVEKVAIVLTDGYQTHASGAKSLKEAAQPLWEAGVRVIAVGIGGDVEKSQLRMMVESDLDALMVRDWDDLKIKVDFIFGHLLVPPPPTNPVDVLFILDSSGSIGKENFKDIEKLFVKMLSGRLQISPSHSRAAFAMYTDMFTVQAPFDRFIHTHDLWKAIDKLPYCGGQSRLDKSIALAAKYISPHARPGVEQLAVILTDGHQSRDANAMSLRESADLLKNVGVSTYAVGIGSDVDISKLHMLVDSEDDVVLIQHPDDLTHNVGAILQAIGDHSKYCPNSVDIAFLMDSSDTISRRSYEKQKSFVKLVAQGLGISSRQSRGGIVLFSDSAFARARFDKYSSTKDFWRAVDILPHLGGKTRIDKALHVASTDIFRHSRPGVKKIAVVLSDGHESQSTGSKSLREATEPLREDEVKVIAVGVGDDVVIENLRSLVESDDDVMMISKSSDPLMTASKLVKRTCAHTPCDSAVDVVFLVDTSGTVGRENFEKEKVFVSLLAQRLGISPDDSRAAVVLYSSEAHTEVPFESHNNTGDFSNAVLKLKFVGGATRLDKALRFAGNLTFPRAKNGVDKIAVILTDGHQSSAADAESLDEAVRPLRLAGVRVIVLGIGGDLETKDLPSLVGSNDDFIIAKNFDDLVGKVDHVAKAICEVKPCNAAVDLAFVMDSSNSITKSNYQREKDFVKTIAKSINIAPGYSRAAVVLFSDNAFLEIRFDQCNNSRDFQNVVDQLRHLKKQTRIDLALDVTEQTFSGIRSRPGVPKIAVVLTDGYMTGGGTSEDLQNVALRLRRKGIRVVAVGVGNQVNQMELEAMTESNADIYRPASFRDLKTKLGGITKSICDVEMCQSPLDVAFVLDSSGSISKSDYQRQKDFVKGVVDSLDISPTHSRSAIVLFSSDAEIKARFNDHTRAKDVRSAVDELPHIQGTTRIDLALNKANEVFEEGRNVTKLAIVLTDGMLTGGGNSNDLKTAAQRLWSKEVRVISIGVGSAVNQAELRAMTQSNADVITPKSFEDLKQKLRSIVRNICDNERCYSPVEVAFVVDSSGSMSEDDYSKQKDFLKGITRSLDMSPQHCRAGLVLFSDAAEIKAELDTYRSSKDVERAIEQLPHIKGNTRIDLALEEANKVLAHARAGVPKVAVILTDGKMTGGGTIENLRDAAKRLSDAGVRVLVVGIGRNLDENELRYMTKSDDDIFRPDSFNRLRSEIKRIVQKVCDKETCPFPVDLAFIMDSSGSIGNKTFQHEKQITKLLSERLGISPTHGRAAVVMYSHNASVEAGFDQYKSERDFWKAVDDLPFLDGGTRINEAITLAQDVFNASREGVAKVAIVLTDARQDKSATSLKKVSDSLRKQGVRVMAVGMGSDVDTHELKSIGKSGNNVVFANHRGVGYNDALKKFRSEICGRQPCKAPVDVAFLMDSSGSISDADYQKEKDFVKLLADELDISPNQSRVAIVLYSNFAQVEATFDSYTNARDFSRAVNKLIHMKSTTRIDKALEVAQQQIFSHARAGISKVAIVLTDGEQSNKNDPVDPAKDLRKASEPLRSSGVRVLALGIGNAPNKKELRHMTDADDDVIMPKDFDDLKLRVNNIRKAICEPKSCAIPTDVAFVIDSSGSISQEDYKKQKDFVKSVASSLNISPTYSRAAIVLFSNDAHVKAALGQYNSFDDFEKVVDSLPHLKSSTRIDRALGTVDTKIFADARANVTKLTIVLTDGVQDKEGGKLSVASEPLRRKDVRVVAVGIGPHVSKSELRLMVESPDDVVEPKDFNDLKQKVEEIRRRICEPVRCAVPADVVFVLDASDKDKNNDFAQMKEFVKIVSRSLGNHTRVAVVLYGGNAEVRVGFNDTTTQGDFEIAVDNLQRLQGEGKIYKALKTASDLFEDARDGVAKVTIILTHAQNPKELALNDEPLNRLRKQGVRVLATGVGDHVDYNGLRYLTETEEDVMLIKNSDHLKQILGSSIRRLCDPKPCDSLADVVFLMDASGSMGNNNFEVEKNFVRQVARGLGVSPDISRVGIVVYNNTAFIKAKFDDYPNLPEIEKAVEELPYYPRGYTRIDKALKKAEQIFDDARDGVAKIAIVLTDGVQQDDPNNLGKDPIKSLSSAAAPLNEKGVTILAIGVGKNVNRTELLELVKSDDDLLLPRDFKELTQKVDHLRSRVCESKPCETTVDIAFLLDSSGSINDRDYKKEKDFVKKAARRLGLSPAGTRCALVLYSTYAKVEAKFGQLDNPRDFDRVVDNLPHFKKFTRIDRAIARAEKVIFPEARPNVTKVLVVLTDGKQYEESPTEPIKGLRESSEALRADGVHFIAVGVGEADATELREMTESDDDVLMSKNFDELNSKLQELVRTVCEAKEPTRCDTPVDITFVVDSSGSIKSDYGKEKDFVKEVARSVNIAPNKSQAAIVLFSDSVRVYGFEEHSTAQEFYTAVDNLVFLGRGTRIDLALKAARDQVFTDKELNARPEVPKLLMVLTDGGQSAGKTANDLKTISAELRRKHVQVLPIGIGGNVKLGELEAMAESKNDVFLAKDLDGLKQKLRNIVKRVCEIRSCETPVDVAFLMDSSGSIEKDYKKEKKFVKSLVKSLLDTSAGGGRAAIVLFSDKAVVKATFDQYASLAEFQKTVDKLPLLNKSTRIDLALRKAKDELFKQPRDEVASIAIVLTDGENDKDAESLKDASEPLREAGVHIVAVGIGAVNKKELEEMTDFKDDVIVSGSFEELQRKIHAIAQKACDKTKLKYCPAVTDVVYVMDSSGSIEVHDYQKEKDFVKKMAERQGISSNGSRAAVVLYSDNAKVEVDFDSFGDIREFKRAVDRLPHQRGRTRIDLALKLVSTDLLPKARGNQTLVIILTDGRQTQDADAEDLDKASEALKNSGAHLVAVGVGDADKNELRLMTNSDDDVFMSSDFDKLNKKVYNITKKVCDKAGPKECHIPVDVAFVVDTSGSIKDDDFRKEKDFVKLMAKSVGIPTSGSRGALLVYSNSNNQFVQLNFSLSQRLNRTEDFDRKVDKLRVIGGGTRIDKALKLTHVDIFSSTTRAGVPRIAVMLTDGKQTRTSGEPALQDLDIASNPLRKSGVRILAVGVGKNVAKSELRKMTEKDEDVIVTNNYDELKRKIHDVAEQLCLIAEEQRKE